MRWYRRRWIQFVAAAAVVAILVPIVGSHPRRRSLRSARDVAPVPVAVAASGRCLALREPMGQAPCPYPAAPAAVDGIDWGAPFEQARGRCIAVGQLAVTSGHVVATDPLVYADQPAFATTMPIGRAPVLLAISDAEDTRDRIAFALLQLAPGRPVRWELATQVGGGGDYAVDAGTGSFADLSTMMLIREREEREGQRTADIATAQVDPADHDAWHRAAAAAAAQVPDFLEVMRSEGYADHAFVNLCIDPATGANLVAFTSGLGDGVYRSYVGRDAAGAVVALVTDFRVVDLGAGRHPWLEH